MGIIICGVGKIPNCRYPSPEIVVGVCVAAVWGAESENKKHDFFFTSMTTMKKKGAKPGHNVTFTTTDSNSAERDTIFVPTTAAVVGRLKGGPPIEERSMQMHPSVHSV